MMGEVVERYPNGNYKIRAAKKVPYRGGQRVMTLVAVAQAKDLDNKDVINAERLYEYTLRAYK